MALSLALWFGLMGAAPASAKVSKKANHRAHAAKKAPAEMIIDKIVIKGNHKIEADAIKAKLVSKVGTPFSAETVRQDIQQLFDLGYFYDVQVDRDEGPKITLTYTVVEKPSIAEIIYKGNDEIEENDLKEAATIKPYEILNMEKIHEAQDKLQKLYEDKGFFLARISYKVEPEKDG